MHIDELLYYSHGIFNDLTCIHYKPFYPVGIPHDTATQYDVVLVQWNIVTFLVRQLPASTETEPIQ